MQRLFCLIIAVATLFAASAAESRPAPQRAAEPFLLNDGDRVVFLGDTFIEREQQESYLETWLTLRFPDKNILFRNLGWSADTALGESRAGFDPPAKGFDRLKEHLAQVKPTVVFLSHGMANSFAGEKGLSLFEADMRKLVAAIEEISGAGTRFVFLGPIAHENLGAPLPDPAKHNEQLALYSEALRNLAAEKKAPFVNLFEITRAMYSAPLKIPFTDNGIHLTAYGYWRVAPAIVSALGLAQGQWRFMIGSTGDVRPGSTGLKASNFQKTEKGMTFDGEMLTHVPPPPPIAGLTNNALFPRIGVAGMPAGDYALRVNGKAIRVGSSDDFNTGPRFEGGAFHDQVEELRAVIRKKNELYFHRWRPQNETYLFGFRKHEQGQNAREIPMFDPLVSEQEAKIAQLRKLRAVKVEFVPATEQDKTQALRPALTKPLVTSKIDVPKNPQDHPKFDLGEGLEVTLFAENPDLAKPIQMNFDPQGRLWVASSSVYPQIQPGQVANDKILVLTDENGDGKADRSTVFADGLLIPTGVEPGDGGAYVGNSTELLHFKDTDGDGQADQKRVVLSGFGTEDTHHILHTLRWGHDGQLYMNQSIYIHSHIETPHGVVRLNSGGILNLRPPTMELGIHMKGLVNSWGHHFDKFGQSFATDGAGHEGINWVVPQAMYFTYAGARRILGSVSPGSYPKFCGLEVVESEHFPEDWLGSIITCDFRAHRVVRFGINDLDTGYITKELPDVMRTTNVTFRPIDAKIGPDGALYIADWSNPIIQHGEVDFRDPRRDHEHGRIWRVTMKGRPLTPRKDFTKASNAELLNNLSAANGYARQRSRRVLTERGKAILPDLAKWTSEQTTEQGQLEALWMFQSIDEVNGELLGKMLAAKDARVRAAASRVLSFWRDRVPAERRDAALEKLIADEHPRVRMEAMRVLAKIPSAKSAELVLSAVERRMDKFLDYAAWLSINDLAEPWIASIKAGEWKGSDNQLAFGLNALPTEMAVAVLPSVLPKGHFPANGEGIWIELIGKAGSPKELRRVFDQLASLVSVQFSDEGARKALAALSAAAARGVRPEGDLKPVERLFQQGSEQTRAAAVKLAGTWKLQGFAPQYLELARAKATPAPIRQAAFQALRDLGGDEAVKGLTELAGANSELPVRHQAVQSLAAINLKAAIPHAIETLNATTSENESLALWRALLSNRGAAAEVALALPKAGLPPVMARAGMRVAREGGRNEPNLVLALARSLEEEDAKNLTPAELTELIANVTRTGDPARGEIIYRRQELGCVSCHSIGGVGGKVGPDLTSIGASAQVDYLVESLQFPNKKVKEGYHGVLVETKDEQEFSGIMVRETDEQLILRDASNREVPIAKNNINKRSITGSLMPAGLVDGLETQQQLDLYRFMAELGKPGRYDTSKNNVARLIKVASATIDTAQFGDDRVVSRKWEDPAWGTVLTLVDGVVLKDDFQRMVGRVGNRRAPAVYVAAQFSVPQEGSVRLSIENASPMAVYIDGKPATNLTEPSAQLTGGFHTIVIKLDAEKLPEGMRVRSDDVTFSTN